jgi:hypothetical protein
MPTADTGTSGGAIDLTSRPELTQFTANAVVVVVSDGADVRTGTVFYRDAAGIIQSVGYTLNGTTEVNTGVTAERVLRITVSTTSGTRTISLKQGAGGTVRATIAPNETARTIMFYDSASAASQTDRYEKVFFRNGNASLALTGATVTLTADPSARIKIALAASKGDSGSVAARTTSPRPHLRG